jgi:hypothetical protein
MTLEYRDHQKKAREFRRPTGHEAGFWIDDATGQIIDGLCHGEPHDFQLQPVPLRHHAVTSKKHWIDDQQRSVDLVGAAHDQLAIVSNAPPPLLSEPRPLLLIGNGDRP